jgi:DNA-binding transcriptional LysR family regulator
MDIQLANTFLTVLATKSFVAASETLHISQSAVSLRIQKLESLLGKTLLERSKAGVTPTIFGEEFEEYARSFIQLWDETKYQVSLPDGFDNSLSLACQDSLWPELSSVWLSNMSAKYLNTAINFQISGNDNLTRMLVRGTLDIAVLYSPEIRPGLNVEHILDDMLVLVTGDEMVKEISEEHYIYCQWGPEFAIAHSRWFPGLKPPQISLRIGTSIPQYLIKNRKSAYIPYRMADDYVADGSLHFIEGAPSFPFPAYALWTTNKGESKFEFALEELRRAAREAPWIELR